MAKEVKSRLQLKQDTYENWKKATGFIPLFAEPIWVTDTNQIFLGDGKTSAAELVDLVELAFVAGETLTDYILIETSRAIAAEEALNESLALKANANEVYSKVDADATFATFNAEFITVDDIDTICGSPIQEEMLEDNSGGGQTLIIS